MIKAIGAALRKKEISVKELVRSCHRQAEAAADYNMFTADLFEHALNKAEFFQEQINNGNESILCGIPIAIKDNIAVKGEKLSCGSAMLKDFVSPYNATATEKLMSAGAIIVGKTNMDEWGMGSHSQNSFYGGVKNPINQEFSPGGSSGGSAAAVKTGAAIAALGTDTGGSVRLPAAYCGVCGLRPTYGAVSRYGLVAFASSMDTIGVLGNTPNDCYSVFSVIKGADQMDATSKNSEEIRQSNLKICSFTDFLADETDADVYGVIKAVENNCKADFNCIDNAKLSDLEYVVSAYYLLSSAEAASNLARYDGIKYGSRSSEELGFTELVTNNRSLYFGNEAKKRILLGNYALSRDSYGKYYKKALSFRTELRSKINDLLAKYNAIVLPTSLIRVPRLTETESITQNFGNDKCNAIASLCGLPCISIPVGNDSNGMPIGFSVIGRSFSEAQIAEIATTVLKGVNPNV